MTSTIQPPPPSFDPASSLPDPASCETPADAEHDLQISAWLQGLLTIAWADGHFDPEEQAIITAITETELAPNLGLSASSCISPRQLAAILGGDRRLAENFMRTAVMVAIADGVYSSSEDEVLHQFCLALELPLTLLASLRVTLNCGAGATGATNGASNGGTNGGTSAAMMGAIASGLSLSAGLEPPHDSFALLSPMREWLDHLEIHDPRLARFLCKLIPPQCPFERDIELFGRKVVHIPPMCKINPLYEQLVGLRFRALSYLADDCQEDVSKYC